LDAYVDDELPDYIMVMVANDRTKVINQSCWPRFGQLAIKKGQYW
jgi:hypothetical protein